MTQIWVAGPVKSADPASYLPQNKRSGSVLTTAGACGPPGLPTSAPGAREPGERPALQINGPKFRG